MFSKRDYDGKKADVWSSGVFLCVLLFHEYPFGLPDQQAPGGAELFTAFLHRLRDPPCAPVQGHQQAAAAEPSTLMRLPPCCQRPCGRACQQPPAALGPVCSILRCPTSRVPLQQRQSALAERCHGQPAWHRSEPRAGWVMPRRGTPLL